MSVPAIEQVDVAADGADCQGRRCPSPRRPSILEATQHYADDASYPETQMYIPPCPPCAATDSSLEDDAFAPTGKKPSALVTQPEEVELSEAWRSKEPRCIQVGQMPEVAPSAESPLGVQSLVHCRSEMAAPAVSAAGENAFGPSVAVGVPHQDVQSDSAMPLAGTPTTSGFADSVPAKLATAAPCTPPAPTRRTPSPCGSRNKVNGVSPSTGTDILRAQGLPDLAVEEDMEEVLGETQHYAVDSGMASEPEKTSGCAYTDGRQSDVALMLLTPASSRKGRRARPEPSPKTRAIALRDDLANSLLDSSPLPLLAPRSVSKAVQTTADQSGCIGEHQDAIGSVPLEEPPATVPEVQCQDTVEYAVDPDIGHGSRCFDRHAPAGSMNGEASSRSVPIAHMEVSEPHQRPDRFELLLEATQCYEDVGLGRSCVDDEEEEAIDANEEASTQVSASLPEQLEQHEKKIERPAECAGRNAGIVVGHDAEETLRASQRSACVEGYQAAVGNQRSQERVQGSSTGQAAAAFERALVEELSRLHRPPAVVVKRELEAGLEASIRVAFPDVKSDTVYRLSGRETGRLRQDSPRAILHDIGCGLADDPIVVDHHEEARKAIFRRVKQEFHAGTPVKQEEQIQPSGPSLTSMYFDTAGPCSDTNGDFGASETFPRISVPEQQQQQQQQQSFAGGPAIAKASLAQFGADGKGAQSNILLAHTEREHTPERARLAVASPAARVPTPCRQRTFERSPDCRENQCLSDRQSNVTRPDDPRNVLLCTGSSLPSFQIAPEDARNEEITRLEPVLTGERVNRGLIGIEVVQRGRACDAMDSEPEALSEASMDEQDWEEENVSPGWNPAPASDTGPTTGPSQPSPKARHKAWKQLRPCSQASMPAVNQPPKRGAASGSTTALAMEVAVHPLVEQANGATDSLASRLLAEHTPPRKRELHHTEVSVRQRVKEEPLQDHPGIKQEELEGTQHVVKRRRLSKKTKLLTSLRAGCQGRVEPSAEEAILRLAAMQPTAHASTTLRPCFAATGFQLSDRQRRILMKLGGSVVDVWTPDVTHLVADTFRRTTKMMCSIACGVRIVVPDFITASRAADHFVEENPFMLKDEICEIAFARKRNLDGYSMVEAVRRRLLHGPLLSAVHVHCLPSVLEKRELPLLVAAMGGKWLPTFPGMPDHESVLLLGERAQCSEQEREWRSKHKVYDLELLREAACTQVLRKSHYRLR